MNLLWASTWLGPHLNDSSQQPYGFSIMPILQRGKLRLRNVRQLASWKVGTPGFKPRYVWLPALLLQELWPQPQSGGWGWGKSSLLQLSISQSDGGRHRAGGRGTGLWIIAWV